MMKASPKYTVLYARLSQEDSRAGESNSIIHQRLLLEKYAEENGFENVVFFFDDGYTGTNYDRPAWQEIQAMIEAGQVATLIVKDMSRLGREHIQTDWFMEVYFPSKGVRFIAVADNVDSSVEGSDSFNSIRNLFNEEHAKNTSKKVRDVKIIQGENGERTGGRVPYGYIKRSPDSKDLIPDAETAPIVQRIFALCARGKGPSQIARILTNEKVLTPAHYWYRKTGKKTGKMSMDAPYSWSDSTVRGILHNKVYLGHTHTHKTTTVSYKVKTTVKVPEDEQILKEDTHEALISKEVWEIAQGVRSHKQRPPKKQEEPNLFAGVAYCADCGRPLTTYRETSGAHKNRLKCSNYGKHSKNLCTPHCIKEEELKAVTLGDLRRVTDYARSHPLEFAEYIQQKDSKQVKAEISATQKEIADMTRRLAELGAIIRSLYEDKVRGEISIDLFKTLSAGYTEEQKRIESALPEKEEQLQELRESTSNVEAFIAKAKRYASIAELTPEILRVFIKRIEVGEREVKGAHNSPQSIRIEYRDIGIIDDCKANVKKAT